MKLQRRKIDIVVLSDVHLGTHGCRAKELNQYLKSIKPKHLILNGDIIDIWQFKKRYWPKSHMKVIKHIFHLASKGTQVTYITGNHDETLRRFAQLKLGNIKIVNQLALTLNGKKTWFFHGDVFDVIMEHSKWLAVVGSISYDLLIQLNTVINSVRAFFGLKRVSLSKKVKDNVKSAVKYINKFEETASLHARKKGFESIVCGHIHKAEIKDVETKQGTITYLNSGDWIENLTALEYNDGNWEIYSYKDDESDSSITTDPHIDEIELITNLNNKQIFKRMYQDFML